MRTIRAWRPALTDARQTPPALSYRSAEIRADGPMADDCDEIEVVYSAGAEVERSDWMSGATWTEALRVDADAIDDTRIQAGIPLLRDHDAGSVDSVVGVTVPGSHKVAGGMASVRVRLSKAASCADTVTKIRERILRSISVGYRVESWEVEKPKGAPERRTATRWTPMEISVVPVPADAAAHIRAEQPRTEAPMQTDTAPALDAAAIRTQAFADAAEIRRLGVALGLPEVADKLAAAPGVTLDGARAALLDAKVAADANSATRGQTRISVGTEDRDYQRQGLQAALLRRGGSVAKLTEQDEALARQWMSLSMAQIARNMLRAGTPDVDTMSDPAVLKLAMRAQSSSDFPLILAQVVDKSLIAAYAEQPKEYQKIAIGSTVSNLRTRRPTLMSGAVALDSIAEGADYPNRPLLESQETYSAEKRGQIIGLTLEAMLKDDLGAFGRIPAAFAAAAIRAENAKVFGLLNANAAMSDGVALFHATHANLISAAGAAPSATTLAATDKLIRVQTGLNGEKLALQGKILVVPAALYHTAAQLFTPRYAPTAATGVLAGNLAALEVVSHPVLDDSSAVVWYLLADPMQAPIIEYCTPSDTPALSTEEKDGFENDTKQFKVRHWFGAGVIDFRGAAKNPGA